MFENFTPIKSLEEGLFHYQIQDDDVAQNKITYFNFGFEQYKTYFPWDFMSQKLKQRLVQPYILQKSMVNYSRHIFCQTASQCHINLIYSIIALVNLSNQVHDFRDPKVSHLSPNLAIEELTFVKAVNHNNLFFVLSPGKINNTFVCIEVNQTKTEAYRKVLLHKHQLTPSQWQGDFITLTDAKRDSEAKLKKALEKEIIPIEFQHINQIIEEHNNDKY